MAPHARILWFLGTLVLSGAMLLVGTAILRQAQATNLEGGVPLVANVLFIGSLLFGLGGVFFLVLPGPRRDDESSEQPQ